MIHKYLSILFIFFYSFLSFGASSSLQDILEIELEMIVSHDPLLKNKTDSLLMKPTIEGKFKYPMYKNLTLRGEVEFFWDDNRPDIKADKFFVVYKNNNLNVHTGVHEIPLGYIDDNEDIFSTKLSVYKNLHLKDDVQLGTTGRWALNKSDAVFLTVSTRSLLLKNSNAMLVFSRNTENYGLLASYLFTYHVNNDVPLQPSTHSVGLGGFVKGSSFFEIKGESWLTKDTLNQSSPIYAGYVFPQVHLGDWSVGFLAGYSCVTEKNNCKNGLSDYIAHITWNLIREIDMKLMFEASLKKDASIVTEQGYFIRFRAEY